MTKTANREHHCRACAAWVELKRKKGRGACGMYMLPGQGCNLTETDSGFGCIHWQLRGEENRR